MQVVTWELTYLSLDDLCVSLVGGNLRLQKQSCHMPAGCQFDWVWSHLEDAPLERSVRPFLRVTS